MLRCWMVRDITSQKYFNQHCITLEIGSSITHDEFDTFNNVDLLARLTGAPDRSTILVSRGIGAVDTLNLKVHNEVFQYPSEYFIINNGGELRFQLIVDSIYVRKEDQDKGIGVRSVMISIDQAKELGFHSVGLEAAGSASNRSMFFGYHVWPSLGFDADLPSVILGKLPDELQWCARVSDLMQADGGPDWWYYNGVGLELTFELDDDSVSWKLLHEYAKARGISI